MKTLTAITKLSCHVKVIKISTIRLNHTDLKCELAKKIPSERSRITEIRRRQAKDHLEEPKNGMLGLNDLVWETSEHHNEHELVFRGYSIPQILQELPKLPGTTIPPVEGHFWLLLTGKIPTLENVKSLMKDWDSRAIVPFFVEKLIRDTPPTTPPVEQLSRALNTLQSKFVESYTTSGVFKEKYWEMVLEDCMDLISKVPTIAALIYNKLYRHKMFLPMRNPHADWASNFALQLGINNKIFEDLMRLFMILYSDLHGKNFAGASCLSGSALSDPYKSYATGLNQLASHKSGFYAHDHIEFLKRVHDEVGIHPTKQLILEYLMSKDYKNKEIPGYTNLNFKGADPRYTCMINFAKQHFGDDPLLNLAEKMSESISEMNSSLPNVDAISGLLFYLFGIREENFLPVMFGISRSLGLLSSYVWDRALGVPLEKKSELVTISTVKIPEKGTCADFARTHGLSKNKLMQNTDILPITTSAVTNLNVSLRPTSNAQNVISAHQKNNVDLSTTLPTQEISNLQSPASQITYPFSHSQIGLDDRVISVSKVKQNAIEMLPTPQSQNTSSTQASGIASTHNPQFTSNVNHPIPVGSTSLTVSKSDSNSNAKMPGIQSQANANSMISSAQSRPISAQQDGKFSLSHCKQSHLNECESIPQSKETLSNGIESVPQSQQSQSSKISQPSTTNKLTSFKPSEDCIKAENSHSRNQSSDTLGKNSEKIKENKKSRHIMLSKSSSSSINSREAYSNANSFESSKQLKKPQKFNKIYEKNDKTKINSYIKGKQPSTSVKTPGSVDTCK